ncbi:MAG: SUMF1/EgtB/PvdO family nonheme iron enzyme [Proteobacteria bacterium]|nr:SUMF1/EgtB/PvdO family nonheme iron enzyme [Pseudomonadota bacterium]
MTTLYLSSTYEDLKDHRRTVIDALRQSGYQVVNMENYVARDDRPVDACLKDIDQVDMYVGLFAFRYGYIPPKEHGNAEGLSITELEYRRAGQAGKTCLVFLADEKSGWPLNFVDAVTGEGASGAQIKRLRQHLSSEKMSGFFTSPHQLASLVQAAVLQSLIANSSTFKHPAPPAITWDIAQKGSPYPGLAHFTRYFALVYFGRETEVSEVLDRFSQPDGRFLIVSGDSGSGKSSLVDAGVLPRLEADTHAVYMLPSQGDNPFDALLRVLNGPAQLAGLNPFNLAKELVDNPDKLVPSLAQIVQRGLQGKPLVVFIDQLEEIFLSRSEVRLGLTHTDAFLTQIHRATEETPLRVIATIRSDWLHHCYAHPDLLKVLRGLGNYPLGRVAPWLLHDMIAKPAACAGLSITEKLVRRLIDEAGAEPGNLPLLAFVLQALFEKRQGSQLSEDEYNKMGGLTGAIAQHIQAVEAKLEASLGAKTLQTQLTGLFRQLIHLNAESLPSRRRVSRASLDPAGLETVDALIKGRILTAEGSDEPNTVELALGVGEKGGILDNSISSGTITLAHERLSDIWPNLKSWIDRSRDDLHLLRQVRLEAAQWDKKGRCSLCWPHEMLKEVPKMIANLQPDLNEAEWAFIRPEAERLLEELESPDTSHYRRAEIGDRLAQIGDPRPGVGLRPDGLPDIGWVEIPGGTVVLEEGVGEFPVYPFRIARYPVTWMQYRAFLEAEDGYRNEDWWQGLAEREEKPGKQYRHISNCPADNVSWYDAIAFCRWLKFKLGFDIFLPTAWEWQQAATSGRAGFNYPWGPDWREGSANTDESHLGRATAVGMYLHGQSKQGVLDLVGNVWEWCLNEDGRLVQTDEGGDMPREVRGGSWFVDPYRARADSRSGPTPGYRNFDVGFRVLSEPSVT